MQGYVLRCLQTMASDGGLPDVRFNRDRSLDTEPAPGLTEHEKYLFDLKGYIVVRHALSAAQLADARERTALRLARKASCGVALGKAANGHATNSTSSADARSVDFRIRPSCSRTQTPEPGSMRKFPRVKVFLSSLHSHLSSHHTA